MKKILISTTLVALGATSLQAASASGLSEIDKAKPWALSAALRGFYDDNYSTLPTHGAPVLPSGSLDARSSFGFEVSPSASLNLPLEQTFIGLSYVYSLRYYEDRPIHKYDQSHQFNAKLDHNFTDRYKIQLSDSFVIAQEPSLIDPNGLITVPLRSEGNNRRNTASLDMTASLTKELSLQGGYANTLYDYQQTGFASRSALLDRMEHLITANLRWQVQPTTVAILGYQYGIVHYSSNDAIGADPVTGALVGSNIRNNTSHYFYVGADQNFNNQLNGSIRVGAQYIEYHKLGQDDFSPYVDGNLTYAYAKDSYLQFGVRHQHNQTDIAGIASATNLTLDQESTSVYASLNHKITPSLTGSLLGQYQHSVYKGGTANNQADDYFIVGVNFNYRIDQAGHWQAEAGYNYDKLNSDLAFRSYHRNRLFLGVRATY